MTDPTAPAVTAITRVLQRARDDGADDDWTARSILAALTGHGWRRVIEPAPAGGAVVPPTQEFLAARAAIEKGESA